MIDDSPFSRRVIRCTCLSAALFLTVLSTAYANPTVKENQHAGTEDWRLTSVRLDPDSGHGLRSLRIEGYASKTSLYPGEMIAFHVSASPAAEYDIDIYRTGYYSGKGGRHMLRLGGLQAQEQPTPPSGPGRIRECDWPEAAQLTIPEDWHSGVYLAKLTRRDDSSQSYMIFIVKSREPADLLFQSSDLTWQAYNKWPGRDSLYDDGGDRDRFNQYLYTGDTTRVSFDRPYAMYAQLQRVAESIGSGSYLLTEFPMVYWLEKQGYDVAYCSNLDTSNDPAVLERCRVFLSVGHDEYWTRQALENVAAARDRGVSLAFLSGNAILHAVQLRQSGVTGASGRAFSRAGRLREPGRELMGLTTYGTGYGDWVVRDADHWIFEGTGVENGEAIEGLVGWEYHGPPLADIAGLEIVASAELHSYWSSRRGQFAAVVFPGPNGNWGFNAGTIWWSQALSSPPGHVRAATAEARTLGVDRRVQTITENFLRRCLSESKLDLSETTAR